MKDLAEMLKAVAAILWPLIILFFALYYSKEIRAVLSRLRRGKLFGQEVELDKALDELNEGARKAAENLPTLQPTDKSNEDHTLDILRQASHEPKSALMLLSAQLEKEVRQILASTGRFMLGDQNWRLFGGMETLIEHGVMSKVIQESINSFRAVRNQIVHGHSADRDEILRAIDSGLTILKAIRAIPHERHYVYHAGVDVFVDSNGKKLRENVKGVILDSISAGGAQSHRRVFPTLQNHFRKGQEVAWEWDNPNFGESWYRDPDSNNIKYGWKQSLQFTGRALTEV